MLEKLPHAVGSALRGLGPGLEETIYHDEEFSTAPEEITLASPAFADGAAIPARFTEDGAKVSPPLAWRGVPAAAKSVLIVIEDADSPTPAPIVHALVLDLPPGDGELAEAALKSPGAEGSGMTLGKNTFFKTAYLPPDPPPGGGAHRYVFQVYALDRPLGLEEGVGRGAVRDAMKGHVLAKGGFIATYERP